MNEPTELPPVPRVAASLEDLRVGQRVHVVEDDDTDGVLLSNHPAVSEAVNMLAQGSIIVILSDPPPEPVTVSRAAFDRLAEARDAEQFGDGSIQNRTNLLSAARALVDEVRGADE